MTKAERKIYNAAWREHHPNYASQYYLKNAKRILGYQQRWHQASPNYHRGYMVQWRKTHPGVADAWLLKHPDKLKAVTESRRAVANGTLIKSDRCQKCGSKLKVQKHHPDYSKPLEVIWLCYSCHLEEHGKKVRSK
jgi:hypothetical protein